MRIRSITAFINPSQKLPSRQITNLGQFVSRLKNAFEEAGYIVQTMRMATTPFCSWRSKHNLAKFVEQLAEAVSEAGFQYLSIGPAQIDHPESYAHLQELISISPSIFASAEIASLHNQLSPGAITEAARVITQLARTTPDGFTNLRFAALANVKPGSPFLPAAYHRGASPAFAIATEAADLAVAAFHTAGSINEKLAMLTASIQQHASTLESIGLAHARTGGVRYQGIDFSLAPFPDADHSIGAALELLGASNVGSTGMTTSAALITNAIDRAHFKRTGFNGLMYPVLEDSILAARAASGDLHLKDLLLYSAVCGTGLDTIPLPGDTTEEQIRALLFDLAALALRLDKPLTARLMPVPGKKAGDATEFDFPFFANSKVMALDAAHANYQGQPGTLILIDRIQPH